MDRKRLVGLVGLIATWAIPVAKLAVFLVGLAGIPGDLAAWGRMFTALGRQFSVLDWALFAVGLLCLFYASDWRPFQRRSAAFGTGDGLRRGLVGHAQSEFVEEWGYLGRKERGEAVERDTPLGEALAYATFRTWGGTFAKAWVAIFEGAPSHLRDFRQKAREGKIAVWGKQRTNEVFEKVPPEHWSKHGIDHEALIKGVAKTRWTDGHGSDGEEYHDLMVSRAEIEDWCNGR